MGDFMYSKDYRYDEECTAALGVMGHKACHQYPGCGCGVDVAADDSEDKNKIVSYDYQLYAQDSKWLKLQCKATRVERGAGLEVVLGNNKYVMVKYIPYRITFDGVFLLRDKIPSSLGDVFKRV